MPTEKVVPMTPPDTVVSETLTDTVEIFFVANNYFFYLNYCFNQSSLFYNRAELTLISILQILPLH